MSAAVPTSNIKSLDLRPDDSSEFREPAADVLEREGVAKPRGHLESQGVVALEQTHAYSRGKGMRADGQGRAKRQGPLQNDSPESPSALGIRQVIAVEKTDRDLDQLIVPHARDPVLEGRKHFISEFVAGVVRAFMFIDG